MPSPISWVTARVVQSDRRYKNQGQFCQRSRFLRRTKNIIYYIRLSAGKIGEFCSSVCVYLYFYVFVFCSLVGVQGNFTWVTGKQTKFWDGLDNYWPRYLVTVQCHPLPRLELTFIFVFIFLFWDSGWQLTYLVYDNIHIFLDKYIHENVMFHYKTVFFPDMCRFFENGHGLWI